MFMHCIGLRGSVLLLSMILLGGVVRAAEKEHDLTGTWKESYKNSRGGSDSNSELVLEEYRQGKTTCFKGHWDQAAIERGVKTGTTFEWVHLDAKDDRVYAVKGTLSPDGKKIELEYTVRHKDSNKLEYTGQGKYHR
jgi:hypothetical protein